MGIFQLEQNALLVLKRIVNNALETIAYNAIKDIIWSKIDQLSNVYLVLSSTAWFANRMEIAFSVLKDFILIKMEDAFNVQLKIARFVIVWAV